MALLSSAVCYTRINIIRDVSVADHFTCEMKGFPLQMCSLALWSAGHCKEALHETVDSVLGKYFKWTSYLCLSLSPQAPDLKRQQWRERTRVSASNGLLNLYLATILKLINLWCCCPRVLCSEDITKAGLALVSLNIHWTSLRQVAPSAAPGPTKLSIRESINLALALTATSETCWRTGSLASPHTRSTTLHITIWGKAPLDMTILPRLASGCLGNAAVCGVESNCKITTSSRFQFKAFLHLLGLECTWNRKDIKNRGENSQICCIGGNIWNITIFKGSHRGAPLPVLTWAWCTWTTTGSGSAGTSPRYTSQVLDACRVIIPDLSQNTEKSDPKSQNGP